MTLPFLYLFLASACSGGSGSGQAASGQEPPKAGEESPAEQAGAAGPGPQPTEFHVEEGQGVEISGTVSYSGEKKGRIRIDFLQVDPLDPSIPPKLVHTMELARFGPWSVEAPKNLGELRIVGFLDQTGDGPTPDDPAMPWPDSLQVKDAPITGIDLVLSDDAQLGGSGPADGGLEDGKPRSGEPQGERAGGEQAPTTPTGAGEPSQQPAGEAGSGEDSADAPSQQPAPGGGSATTPVTGGEG